MSNCTEIKQDLEQQLELLKAARDAILNALATGATNVTTRRHTLDDGQTRVDAEYRSTEEMTKGLIMINQQINNVSRKLYGSTRTLKQNPCTRPRYIPNFYNGSEY